MGNENVSLRIIGTLDVNATKPIIDAKIKELEKQINKLNLTIQIDDNVMKTLKDFSTQMSKIADIAKNTGKVVQESFNLDGSGTRLTYFNGLKSEFSQVEIAAKNAGDSVKKSNEEQQQSVNKLTQDYQELTKATKTYNQQAELTRTTDTYKNGNNNLKVTNTPSGTNYLETLNPAKDVQDEQKLIEQMEQFRLQTLQKRAQEERLLEQAQAQAINKNAELERQEIAKTQASRQSYEDWWLRSITTREQQEAKQEQQLAEQIANFREKSMQRVLQEQNKLNEAQQQAINKNQEIDRQLQQQISLYQRQAEIQTKALSNNPNKSLSTFQQAGLQEYLNSVKALNTTTPQVDQRMKELALDFKSISMSARTAAETSISFGTAMKEAFAPLQMYFGGFMLFMQGVNQFKEGIGTLNELNKSLTTISMITHQSQDQVAGLAQQYNELGKQLSVSTNEIAVNATELTRQGLSIDEVNSRLKTITEFSKVAGISAQDAMTYITAASNSMRISAQQASDTFAELGHVSGVNAAYIAEAYQKVGGTAGAVGLDFNKVASWITTEGERSKESADTIGSSVKSILARIQSLKEKGFDETDGTKVNQVAKSLSTVGIQLMNAKGEFNDFGKIMDQLGQKWSTLDSRHRAYLATTIAGTYQQSR